MKTMLSMLSMLSMLLMLVLIMKTKKNVPSRLSSQWLHVSKCMSCHKAIVVITGMAHCFHDNIYIILILLL